MASRPGRRPADYNGSQGWLRRIASHTATAAVVGAGVGSVIGLARRQGVIKWSSAVAVNAALATACFCSAQELVRELHASHPEDLMNCVLGGLASGALLGRIQGGPAKALPCALAFAAVGTGLQWGAVELREYRLRHLMTPLPQQELQFEVEKQKSTWKEWQFPEWFPIRRLSQEEADRREEHRQESMRKTVENMRRGQSVD